MSNYEKCLQHITGFLGYLGSTGLRGLVLINSDSVSAFAGRLARTLTGRCVAAASSSLIHVFRGACIAATFPRLPEVLGYEADNAVIATEGFLSPNAIAAMSGLVRAGGSLFILAPGLEAWNPGPRGGRGGYRDYLLSSLGELESLLWLRARGEECSVALKRLPRKRKLVKRRHGKATSGLGDILTIDQAEALNNYVKMRRRLRSLLVLGDRGRGKSFLLGVIVALEASRGLAGEALLVAPSPYSVQSFFRGVIAAATRLRVKTRYRRRGALYTEAELDELMIHYTRPDETKPAPLIVVDEAAAVGVARLRRYSMRAGRVFAATTVHGYEGAGRYLAQHAEKVLSQPLLRLELREPARYLPGDPLEEWVNKVFVLKPQYPDKPPARVGPNRAIIKKVELDELVSDKKLIRQLVSLLSEAHYRMEPDYILTLLESTTHRIYSIILEGIPVAVADVAVEKPEYPEKARLSLKLLSMVLGEEPGFCAARIVRIAVHPSLQRRGLGSKLLRAIEEDMLREGCAVVTALYGRHDVTGFWLRNNYKVYYISPRFNKVTGEKNIAVIKPLTQGISKVVNRAIRGFTKHLLLALHSIYRDVAAENIADIIMAATSLGKALSIEPSLEEVRHALQVLETDKEHLEQVASTIYLAALSLLPGSATRLAREELVALIAYILQGKPLNDVANILGLPLHATREKIAQAVTKLLQYIANEEASPLSTEPH